MNHKIYKIDLNLWSKYQLKTLLIVKLWGGLVLLKNEKLIT